MCSLFWAVSLVSQKRANKACTRRWGFWRDSKHFSTPYPFFQSDGVPPPDPARVTQTVSRLPCKNLFSYVKIKA